MLYGKSARDAATDTRVVQVNSRDYILSGYVGASPVRGYYLEGNEVNDNGEPQGFLVEQPPGAVTLPHFHETNQFQVVVGGAGHFGKQAAMPLSLQYANAHTPYGPIISGDEGIVYFTLRAKWDPGAKYMPASRDKLIKGNQRSKLISGIEVGPASALAGRPGVLAETVITPEAWPPGCFEWARAPYSKTRIPEPAAGNTLSSPKDRGCMAAGNCPAFRACSSPPMRRRSACWPVPAVSSCWSCNFRSPDRLRFRAIARYTPLPWPHRF